MNDHDAGDAEDDHYFNYRYFPMNFIISTIKQAIQPSILGRGVALCMTRLSLFAETEFDGTRQRGFLFKRWFTMIWNWNSRNFNKILIFYCLPLFQFCLVLFVDGFCTRFIRLNLNVIGNSWNFNRIQKNILKPKEANVILLFFSSGFSQLFSFFLLFSSSSSSSNDCH